MVFANHILEFLFAIPFVGMLLSIALGPILMPVFWHHHYFKIAFVWGGMGIISLLLRFDSPVVWGALQHTILHDYLPFVILIGALFIITSGIHIHIAGKGTALVNMLILAIGGALASFIGTTGAAMLLIRPLIRLNSARKNKVHVIVFFIFIVANIGGCLTPLGDPPLFLGYLKGVSFIWPIYALFLPWLLMMGALLIIFYGIDHYFWQQESRQKAAVEQRQQGEVQQVDGVNNQPKTQLKTYAQTQPKIQIEGFFNLIPLLGVVFVVWLSGVWSDSPMLGGTDLRMASVVRDLMLVVFGGMSWLITPSVIHQENHFSWAPFVEVAKIFMVIFITVIPVVAMLNSGLDGPFSQLLTRANPNGIPDNHFYFWATGLLSAFLDNAPTYLVFFHMAGGQASVLMTDFKETLMAISCGAVFMGALTYIGNAPNFMIRGIAEKAHIKMPGFLGYMGWSFSILLPLLLLLDFLCFR